MLFHLFLGNYVLQQHFLQKSLYSECFPVPSSVHSPSVPSQHVQSQHNSLFMVIWDNTWVLPHLVVLPLTSPSKQKQLGTDKERLALASPAGESHTRACTGHISVHRKIKDSSAIYSSPLGHPTMRDGLEKCVFSAS